MKTIVVFTLALLITSISGAVPVKSSTQPQNAGTELTNEKIISYAATSGETDKSVTTLPKTIRVYRTATGKIDVVDFKYYVKNVMDNEWGIPAWSQNTLEVGAMAVKNYGWYWTAHQKYPGLGYDVKDNTADQVYKPGSEQDYTNKAVEATWNYTMLKDGELFESEYDSGIEEGSTEALYLGRLAMWGAVEYDKQGKDWQWILHKYYDPITIKNIVNSHEQVKSNPVANFEPDVKSGTAPLVVQFTDLSKDATSWKWNFGDEGTSTAQNPKHTYSTAGSYTVILTANNENGRNSISKTIAVKAPQDSMSEIKNTHLPAANFETNVLRGTAPLAVKFKNLSKDATSYKWSFGDGTYCTQKNPKHTYNKAGKYTVRLTSKNENGSNSITKTITVLKNRYRN